MGWGHQNSEYEQTISGTAAVHISVASTCSIQ